MIRLLFLLLLSSPADADTVVAARTIPAQTLIAPADIALSPQDLSGGETDPALFIGMEARVALYAGRPIRVGDVGLPAIIERNQILPLVYDHGGLVVRTEGRALARAGAGELIRIMNMSSRTTVSATIGADGQAYVIVGGR